MTEKQDIQKKKRQREVALANLSGNIGNLASMYLINSSGQFGEAVVDAVERYVYLPALEGSFEYNDPETLKKGNIISQGLISSREDGQRFSGSISEKYILETATAINQASLAYTTVEDVFKLMEAGSSAVDKTKRKLAGLLGKGKDEKDFYISELPEEKAKNVIGSYQAFLMYDKAVRALFMAREEIPGNLEKLLTKKPEEKKDA